MLVKLFYCGVHEEMDMFFYKELRIFVFMIDFSVLRHGRRLDMVQKAQMSSGPTGGDNTLYYVLVGATFLGAGVYVSTPLLLESSSAPY